MINMIDQIKPKPIKQSLFEYKCNNEVEYNFLLSNKYGWKLQLGKTHFHEDALEMVFPYIHTNWIGLKRKKLYRILLKSSTHFDDILGYRSVVKQYESKQFNIVQNTFKQTLFHFF